MGALPKGQRAIDDFPRFGLQQFQHRFPDQIERVAFEVRGDVEKPLTRWVSRIFLERHLRKRGG